MAVSVACVAIFWTTPGFKGRTFKLCVLIASDFNFCVCSSQLRGKERRMKTGNNREEENEQIKDEYEEGGIEEGKGKKRQNRKTERRDDEYTRKRLGTS